MNYLNKYLKYKNKYNALKTQTGSAGRNLNPKPSKRGRARSRLFIDGEGDGEGKGKGEGDGEGKGEGEIQKKSRTRSESPNPDKRPTYHESKSEPDRNQSMINDFFLGFDIKQITAIIDTKNKIHLDGYTANIYGENPINDFDICNRPQLNKYGNIDEKMIIECKHPDIFDKLYKMGWSNPDKAKLMNKLFHNVLLSDLVHPIEINSKTSYTYVVTFNTISNNYSIIFCQVSNITEIGAKHTIIADSQCVIVSGELAIIKKNVSEYEYVININSSLMKHKDNKLNIKNNITSKLDSRYSLGNKFYYIYKYNIIYKLLKLLNPECNIRIMKNTIIKINDEPTIYSYDPYNKENEVLFDFYTVDTPLCVSPEFVKKYNEFGMKEHHTSLDGHRICIDVVEGIAPFTEIKNERGRYYCDPEKY